jgi:hypothetical protein
VCALPDAKCTDYSDDLQQSASGGGTVSHSTICFAKKWRTRVRLAWEPPKVTVSLFSCSSSLIPKISLVDFLLQKTLKSKKESFFKD